MLAWLSIILVNSKIFKLSFNLSLTHLRALIVCYELKGDLSHLMLKIFHETFENFETTNHASKTGWQTLFFSYKCFKLWQPLQLLLLRCMAENSPNFNMLFQLVLTKFFKVNCFLVYRKLIMWSSHAKSLLTFRQLFLVEVIYFKWLSLADTV